MDQPGLKLRLVDLKKRPFAFGHLGNIEVAKQLLPPKFLWNQLGDYYIHGD